MSEKNVSNFDVVIFGVTGNLSKKKLIPSLFNLYKDGHISNFRIIGFARRNFTDEELKIYVEDSLWQEESTALVDDFLKFFIYLSGDFREKGAYIKLSSLLKNRETIYYLSTSPKFYGIIIENLKPYSFNDNPYLSKIILEKPFGSSLDTARFLNSLLYSVFKEEQIYRIDHYLGKETVQNIFTFRFGNSIFENIWNNRYVDFVQITVAEEVGIDGRAEYYDSFGALRDMIQNHILQLLSLVAMEPPISFNADFIHDEKVKVLKSLRKLNKENMESHIVKGQYVCSRVQGVLKKGYKEEAEFLNTSNTETYLAMKLFIDNWRWFGVPFYIRTGKALVRKFSEIYIQFKKPGFTIFNTGLSNLSNALIFRIQPRDGIEIKFNTKRPGYNYEIQEANMEFSYHASFNKFFGESYERLLFDAFLGDRTLYARNDEIDISWEFVSDILDKWEDVKNWDYFYGSEGPVEANMVLEKDHFWRKM
ncbi:glucose-6-phosphate dehydrogenase [Borrelia miyamotoi]|uniref:Glucose-6-phosphate 1-dehydrogenase n=1 Tax=Borrelia miyamotoi TaxID=47466 RepID=A0AAX3JLM3_9SPIR|nr:glucose-6-phosphate dehydrogenase [Borrelia miyamotoi]QFP41734.1 glucose-6-phosphate dehydrogenase [Borrelia miyamotoi]QFP47854.1 glucose-6-phosphate dehydrogenase [Borrelia miyamotoi]QGT55614.1 glucose-6-phosphate dehydrogenase [Borrelia miyamotoi]QGT56398.1 glucose-6-phosphate dehydrogenase [Borrelia miyamotoi]WAZ71643.1 glucose-6-phosphate dehydrogenase [Borrelia miyamotoi]